MNFFVKACMTVLMLAIGVVPAVVLHAGSLPPIGGNTSPTHGGPEVVEPEPAADPEPPALVEPADDASADGWIHWPGDGDPDAQPGLGQEEVPASADPYDPYGQSDPYDPYDSYGQSDPYDPYDPYGQSDPSDPSDPYEPYDPYGTGEPSPEPTASEPAPTEPPADDGGLLGDLLGG